jgi:hypothetical protein
MHSLDSGKTWKPLQLNLPTVPVHDLIVKGDDLVLATHGRSIWILDELTPVRETTTGVRNKPAHLFPPTPAIRWRVSWGGPTSEYLPHTAGQNPSEGSTIWFHLGQSFKGEAKLEILDSKGTVIAIASGKYDPTAPPAADPPDEEDEDGPPKRKLEPKPGLNQFVWDLTHDGATVISGARVDSGAAGTHIPVAPGTYTIRLTASGQKLTQTIDVKADPRWSRLVAPSIPMARDTPTFQPAGKGEKDIPPAEFEELKRLLEKIEPLAFVVPGSSSALIDQEKLALRVRDDISKLSDVVARLRAVKKQLDLRKDLLKDHDEAKDLLKQSESLDKKLNGIEEKLHNAKAKISYDIFALKGGAMLYSQFAWLLGNLTDSDGAPTKAQQELADELEKELAGLTSQFETVAKNDIVKLNATAKKLGVPELYVPPAKKKEEAKPEKKAK